MTMTDCEVCLRPTISPVIVTFKIDGIEPTDVAYCTECTVVVFEAMVKRYKEMLAARNGEVAQVLRMLGVDLPNDWSTS